MPEEELEARGYEYTEWDCPNCDEVNRAEGDVKGEQLECGACSAKVWIV